MLPTLTLFALGLVSPLVAQQPDAQVTGEQDTVVVEQAATDSLIGAAVSVGSDEATLELQLADGRTVQLELRDGIVYADGRSLGTYGEGGPLDRSWRALLDEAAMASTAELPALLRLWEPPRGAGALGNQLDDRLEQALAGVGGRLVTRTAPPAEDSIDKLLARVRELEARSGRDRVIIENRWDMPDVVEDFVEGIGMVFATLVWFGVLFGLGSALLFFGNGRVERIAATVREEPVRSGLIGLAGAFLAIPFYVLVILALVISILGIPLVIAWAPLFPMLVVLAGITGWLAVAFGAGDALVRGRLRERAWFQDAGLFKRIAVGIALLLSPFALAALFQMTSLLEWVGSLLFGLGILANILLTAVGFGAVLVRGAAGLERQRERRAARRRAALEAQPQEGTNV